MLCELESHVRITFCCSHLCNVTNFMTEICEDREQLLVWQVTLLHCSVKYLCNKQESLSVRKWLLTLTLSLNTELTSRFYL